MPELYIPDFSYKDFLTYEIKDGDTPDSVAAKMQIEVYALRSYHNRYCPLKDAIGPTFPRHLKFLIIKPQEKEFTEEEKEQHRKNVVFNDGPGKFSLNYSHGEYTYGVLCSIETGKETHTVKYKIKVTWLAQNNGYYFYKIAREEEIYINDTAPSTMAEEMAHQAVKTLYPLTIVVNEKGRWIDIYNFDEIKKRWQETKKQITKYYKGDSVEKYLSLHDKNMKNSDILLLSIKNDWFLNALFNEIHVQYPPTKSITKTARFPYLAKTESLKYDVEQVIDERLDVDNFIVIYINGKLNDGRSKTDFENGLNLPKKEYSEEKITGNYKAKYFLNPNNYMPEAFIVSWDLALETPQKYTVTATNLHTAKELVIASRKPLIVGVNNTRQKSESSFWYFFIMTLILITAIYGLIKYFIYKF